MQDNGNIVTQNGLLCDIPACNCGAQHLRKTGAQKTKLRQQDDAMVVALKELVDTFQTGYDSEYCAYAEYLRKDVCLGEEAKMAAGKFGKKELEARIYAAELYGKSLAYAVCAKRLKAAIAALTTPNQPINNQPKGD